MSFWSVLSKIGSAVVPFIPGIGPTAMLAKNLISTGLGATGNLLDSRNNKVSGSGQEATASGSTPTTTGSTASGGGGLALDPAIQSLLGDIKGTAKSTQEMGKLAMSTGEETISPAKNFFKTALSGNREALQDLLGPEISTVMGQYDAAKTSSEFAPRGGGRLGVLAEQPFAKAGAYGKALVGARTGAADKLAGIGEKESLRGLDLLKSGNASEASPFAALLNRQNDVDRRASDQDRLGLDRDRLSLDRDRMNKEGSDRKRSDLLGLGKGIGDILITILNNKNANKKSATAMPPVVK